MSASRKRVVMVALFVVGVALMVPFDNVVTLTLGVIFLFAFVAFGAVLIAGPGASALADDEHKGDSPL
jgi:hypothetical protein